MSSNKLKRQNSRKAKFLMKSESDGQLNINPKKKKTANNEKPIIETPDQVNSSPSTTTLNEDANNDVKVIQIESKCRQELDGYRDENEEGENFEKLNDCYRESLIEKSEMEKSKSELEQEIAEKNLKIDQLVKELDSSFTNELKPNADIEALRKEIAEKEREVETMQERYKESQTHLSVLVERCDHFAMQIDENKSTITNLQTMNDSLRKSNSALVHEIVVNSSRISECNDTIHEVEHELAEKYGDISTLKSELRISYADLKDLCNELSSSQEKVRLLEQNLDEKSSKVEELCVDLHVKSKQVSSLQTDLGILEYELNGLKKSAVRSTKLDLADPIYTFGYIAAAAMIGVYSAIKVFSK